MSEQEINKEQPAELTEDQLDQVEGGLLLPAVQKVREAAARISSSQSSTSGITDGTSNIVAGDGSV